MSADHKYDVSIVIVNYNSGKYLLNTVRSIFDSRPAVNFEIIIVDNHSSDDSVAAAREEFPGIKTLMLEQNHGFATANNRGAETAEGEYILILNNDTEIAPGSMDSLVAELKNHPEYGIVSPLLFFEDGRPQLSFGPDPGIGSEFFTKFFLRSLFLLQLKITGKKFEKNADWISGACFLISSPLYSELGGFDEKFFLYYEDADLGKRVRKTGRLNHITSKSRIIHFLGKSAGPVFSSLLPVIKKGQLHYYRKHHSRCSFFVLKQYLIFKYTLKSAAAALSGKKDTAQKFRELVNTVKKENHEKTDP